MDGQSGRGMTATDRVYAFVRDQILSGALQMGERLGEAALAAELGVSRTPVREALRKLGADGYLDLKVHAGAAVRQWDRDEIRSSFTIRAEIEGHAAARAAELITRAELAGLEQLCDRMEAASASKTAPHSPLRSDLNRELHVQILKIAGLAQAEKVAVQLMDVAVLNLTYERFNAEQAARSDSDHRLLLLALRLRDAPLAQSVMRTHILTAPAVLETRR